MTTLNKPLVLIAEDDGNILISLDFLLSNAGYRLITAAHGDAALAALATLTQEPPALVVLDVMLPAVDGLEICKRIRADPAYANTRVLMLSARGRESEIAAGLKLGSDAYMTKPFATRALLAKVSDLLTAQQPGGSA